MIWCDFNEVWLGLSGFIFGVVWCLLVWLGVICTFFGANRCFMVFFVSESFGMILLRSGLI